MVCVVSVVQAVHRIASNISAYFLILPILFGVNFWIFKREGKALLYIVFIALKCRC